MTRNTRDLKHGLNKIVTIPVHVVGDRVHVVRERLAIEVRGISPDDAGEERLADYGMVPGRNQAMQLDSPLFGQLHGKRLQQARSAIEFPAAVGLEFSHESAEGGIVGGLDQTCCLQVIAEALVAQANDLAVPEQVAGNDAFIQESVGERAVPLSIGQHLLADGLEAREGHPVAIRIQHHLGEAHDYRVHVVGLRPIVAPGTIGEAPIRFAQELLKEPRDAGPSSGQGFLPGSAERFAEQLEEQRIGVLRNEQREIGSVQTQRSKNLADASHS